MIDQNFLDALNFKGEALGTRWRDQIRKAPQLRAYNAKSDTELLALTLPLYPKLARSLERGIDKNMLGAFFVKMGKDRMRQGYPLSETVFALNICRQIVIEYLESEVVMDNTVQLYQAIGTGSDVAEFFFMGSFYLTKGSLEGIYESMYANGHMSDELLKKYFTDDFFFKRPVDE
jgi:hypothetical protein